MVAVEGGRQFFTTRRDAVGDPAALRARLARRVAYPCSASCGSFDVMRICHLLCDHGEFRSD